MFNTSLKAPISHPSKLQSSLGRVIDLLLQTVYFVHSKDKFHSIALWHYVILIGKIRRKEIVEPRRIVERVEYIF